jgi:copper chaperone NosL
MKVFNLFVMLVSSVFITVLAGCAGKVYSPSPINEAVDVCAECGMTVRDNGYASEIITADGKVLKFDDVGDLFKYARENRSLSVGAEFVQDKNTKEWLALDKAYLVTNRSVPTPMNWGIHAFKTKEEADKFSASITNATNASGADGQDNSKMKM